MKQIQRIHLLETTCEQAGTMNYELGGIENAASQFEPDNSRSNRMPLVQAAARTQANMMTDLLRIEQNAEKESFCSANATTQSNERCGRKRFYGTKSYPDY